MKNKNIETTVVFGDVHGIYVDRKSWSILLQVIYDIKPDRVIINGDFIDCYSISTFDKDPERDFNLQDEYEQANKLLDELQHIFKGEIIFVFGNHEARQLKNIWKNTPEYACIPELTIEGKLHLEERGIKFVKPKGKDAYYQLGKIKVGHFNKASQHSAYTEKWLVDKYGCCIVQGHSHRLGKHYKTIDNDTIVGVGSGCLCNLDPEYVSDPNWQQGFVVIDKLKNDKWFQIQDVPIINHTTLFKGKLYAS